jgi:hypothetical protein
VVTTIDLEDIIADASKLVHEPGEPVSITQPTPGVVLEATVGQCDACEDYIREHRLLELRVKEAEADRREQRLAAEPPDLTDPAAPLPAPITVRLEKPPGS